VALLAFLISGVLGFTRRGIPKVPGGRRNLAAMKILS
jgi:hypothetical protein